MDAPPPSERSMTLQLRAYRPTDRDACIEIFRSNVPRFFRDRELDGYLEFVDSSGCPYFVVLSKARVIGCGGFGIRSGSDTADLCWGMVHREQHGSGIGRFLLLARLHAIVTTTRARYVRLATSQLTEGFFHRNGFQIQTRTPGGIAAGLDEVEMRMELTDGNRFLVEREWRKMTNGPSRL
jgi:GNAT superfamily N-acetyltransferase